MKPTTSLPALLALFLALAPPGLAARSTAVAAETPSAVERALKALDGGDLAGAIALLEPLRRTPGADPRALALLGALYVEGGRDDDALAVLEPLTTLDAPDPAVLYNAARAARAAGRMDRVEPWLERSAALSPVSPAARDLGLLRGRQGRIGDSLRLLWPWVQANPTDAEARFAAAQAALRIGRAPEARTLLEPLDPAAAATRLLKAELAMLEGNPAGAVAELEPVLAQGAGELERDARGVTADAYLALDDPAAAARVLAGKVADDPQLALLLARAQRQMGKVGEAIATLKPLAEPLIQGGRGSPLAGALVLEYGRTLVASGRSREGSAALRRAVELNPRSRLGWESLAEALTALGQTEEAGKAAAHARDLAAADQVRAAPGPARPGEASLQPILEALGASDPERALALARAEAQRAPEDPRPRLLEVRILLSLNRTEEANRVAEALVAAFPTLADAVYQRGLIRMALGDAGTAERDLRQALELSPQFIPALNDLAVLLMTQKRFAEARPLLEQVLALNPDDRLARENMSHLPPGS